MIGKDLAKRTKQLVRERTVDSHTYTGVVVDVGTGVATIVINASEVEIPDVPYIAAVDGDLEADDIVHLDWIGDSPVIVGRY